MLSMSINTLHLEGKHTLVLVSSHIFLIGYNAEAE